MSLNTDIKYEYLRSCYSRLFEFYLSGKLTNVTWVFGPEEDEEHVSAHYSICALSNRLRELMASQPFSGAHKLCIRVPSSLTPSASDLRHILYLAYKGDFEQGVTLQRYVQLCELFDMPLGITACTLALRDLLRETASFGKLSDEAILGLQALFTDVLSTSKTEEIRHYVIEYFAFQPLTFIHEKCLATLPLDKVVTLLKEGKLWMHDAEGNVFFGEAYMKWCTKFVKKFCEVHKVVQEATLLSVESVPQKSMFAPLYLLPSASIPFGSHAEYFSNYNFSALPQKHLTHEMYPPDSWKISALKGYIANNWDGRQPLAGLDVTYRNFRTGVEETVTWGGRQDGDHTTLTVVVPEDDVIVGAIIRDGWLIDQITFVTLGGIHLGPLGLSGGGNETTLNVKDYWSTLDEGGRSRSDTHNSSDYDSPHYSDEYDFFSRIPSESNLEVKYHTAVSLHGFTYKEISSHGQVFWNQVQFHFAAIDESTVRELSPVISGNLSDVLRSKQFHL